MSSYPEYIFYFRTNTTPEEKASNYASAIFKPSSTGLQILCKKPHSEETRTFIPPLKLVSPRPYDPDEEDEETTEALLELSAFQKQWRKYLDSKTKIYPITYMFDILTYDLAVSASISWLPPGKYLQSCILLTGITRLDSGEHLPLPDTGSELAYWDPRKDWKWKMIPYLINGRKEKKRRKREEEIKAYSTEEENIINEVNNNNNNNNNNNL